MMLGLDGAGKTTILYKLIHGKIIATVPTFGFNVETIEYKNNRLTVWDIGGQDKVRPLYMHYLQGIIIVLDSNDRDRTSKAREDLLRIMNVDKLKRVPLLIFANKQGLPNAMSTSELIEKLDLQNLKQPWVSSSSTTRVAHHGRNYVVHPAHFCNYRTRSL